MEILQTNRIVKSQNIIPLKLRNHYVVQKLNYNVDAKYNKVYLPVYNNIESFKIHPRKIFSHQVNKPKYELYVENKLNDIEDIYELDSLYGILSDSLKFKSGTMEQKRLKLLDLLFYEKIE